MKMNHFKILQLVIVVAILKKSHVVESFSHDQNPQNATIRYIKFNRAVTEMCSIKRFKKVLLVIGETYTLHPRIIIPASFCGFRLVAPSGYKVSLNCQTVNLPGDFIIEISSPGLTQHSSIFNILSSGRFLKMESSSPTNQAEDMSGSFECEAIATDSDTTVSPITTVTASPSSCKCGVPLDDRIVGGQDAAEAAYNWIVSFGSTAYCAGSLITPTKILTAAHCGSQSGFTVYLGQYNRGVNHDYTITRTVLDLKRHPSYRGRSNDYDLSVLTIDAVPLSNEIGVICLPDDTSDTYDGKTVTTIGWGVEAFGANSQPNILQEVEVIVLSNTDCSSQYGSSSITDRMICAGVSGGGKDACQGDSGGPLMYKAATAYELVGIVSWGDECALPDKAGVYSRVTDMKEWVLEEIGGAGELCDRL